MCLFSITSEKIKLISSSLSQHHVLSSSLYSMKGEIQHVTWEKGYAKGKRNSKVVQWEGTRNGARLERPEVLTYGAYHPD